MKKLACAVCSVVLALLGMTVTAFAQESDQVPTNFLSNKNSIHAALSPRGHRNGQGHATFGIANVDTIRNFNKHFEASGVDQNGNPQVTWYYNMVGAPPEHGGTTTINAPIVPVSLDLRNADGSPRFVNGHRLFYDVTPFIAPTVNSPVFQNTNWTSSPVPTQYTDAVQRAEFFSMEKSDWHTLLSPAVASTKVMVFLRGTYRFALNPDGTCCLFVLIDANTFVNELFPSTFPFDNSTPVGAAENLGEVTTKDISTFLFPNAFLFVNGNPNQCCILGFHTFDFEPGIPSNGNLPRFFVLNYSSWISPGLFGGGFEDVTATSHEMSETFNDPFVTFDGIHDVVPWWTSGGNCQDNLEDGDVIEGLPDAVFPVPLNGMTYHTQNEALLQWFEFQSPSSALGGAYSFPDPTTLVNLSLPQKLGCAP